MPPHLTLNLPCVFVFVFLLFCLLCLFRFVLFLWVGLCLLFWFLLVNNNAVFTAILVVFGRNVGSRYMFQFCFGILFLLCFFAFLFLEVGNVLCIVFCQKNHNRLFACFGILFFYSSSWLFPLVLILVGLSFSIKKQAQNPGTRTQNLPKEKPKNRKRKNKKQKQKYSNKTTQKQKKPVKNQERKGPHLTLNLPNPNRRTKPTKPAKQHWKTNILSTFETIQKNKIET